MDWLEGRLRALSGRVTAHVFGHHAGRMVAVMSRNGNGEIHFSFI